MAAGGMTTRLRAIDALRGMVMLFMLLDHVRETFYLHHQVTDPMDAQSIDPALFFTRLTSQICAPVFIGLTGVSAWLYGRTHDRRDTALFLVKRGGFLILLELTLVGFAWTAQFPPTTFWLQVIWCIGWCMIALAALMHLPRPLVLGLGAAIIGGHDLLDGVVLTPEAPFFPLWAVLHQRAVIDLGGGMAAKTTYPILPWIGVILLGYGIGPWFSAEVTPAIRLRNLWRTGLALTATFFLLRGLNLYGDKPWTPDDSPLRSAMSFLALTKYPPSLLFLLSTLGPGLFLLAALERIERSRLVALLAVLGGAPMFFYLLHLYVLKTLYLVAISLWGTDQGTLFGFETVRPVWATAVLLIVPLYFPTRWFADLKRRRRDLRWLSYW